MVNSKLCIFAAFTLSVFVFSACGDEHTDYGGSSGDTGSSGGTSSGNTSSGTTSSGSTSSGGANTLTYLGAVKTKDPNGDQMLNAGENITPEVNMACVQKPSCSFDIYAEWEICLVEKFIKNGMPTEAISIDLTNQPICATHRTDFFCVNNQFETGSTQCIKGFYCSYTMDSSNTPMTCGWKIVNGQVFKASDGTLIEGLTIEKLQSFGYDLFPVEQTMP